MVYRVTGVATHTETDEPLVVYKALYGSREVHARPLSMWEERVNRQMDFGHYDGRRFRRIDEVIPTMSVEEISDLIEILVRVD